MIPSRFCGLMRRPILASCWWRTAGMLAVLCLLLGALVPRVSAAPLELRDDQLSS